MTGVLIPNSGSPSGVGEDGVGGRLSTVSPAQAGVQGPGSGFRHKVRTTA